MLACCRMQVKEVEARPDMENVLTDLVLHDEEGLMREVCAVHAPPAVLCPAFWAVKSLFVRRVQHPSCCCCRAAGPGASFPHAMRCFWLVQHCGLCNCSPCANWTLMRWAGTQACCRLCAYMMHAHIAQR